MRQVIEIVILAALLIMLSVLPGYDRQRTVAATPQPAGQTAGQPADFDPFVFVANLTARGDVQVH